VSINNVHGLGGNLQEWVSDCYVEDFYSNFPQSSIDPFVDGSNCMRVIRGGAFIYGEDFSRTTKRNASDPNNNDLVVGFRCVFNK
jgi:formylglycine-generating enzyme required for sulfatase activity